MDYNKTVATARKALLKFGSASLITLRQFADGAYDPSIGKLVRVSTDSTRIGVELDYGAGAVRGPGGLIEVGDKRILMEAGIVPTLEDIVISDSVLYRVIGKGEIKPAGIPVLYDLHCRR